MTKNKGQLEDRKREFAAYLRLLRHIESRLLPRGAPRRRLGDLPNADSFKAMKATAFLMLCNTIEATIVGALAEVYIAIEQDGCRLHDVTPHIRKMWIEQQFWVPPDDARPSTYRNRAAMLLDQTIKGAILALDTRKLSIGGSLDAELAREVCARHGCRLVVHRRARGGAELGTVKAQRNNLAHGAMTFAECGQAYSVSDLERIGKECINFLAGFVRTLDAFIDRKAYRVE